MSSAYDYPLISGKRLGDATRRDLLAEARIDEEMGLIGEEMGDLTFDQFFEKEPAKAIRMIGYIAQRNFLAERRAKAMGQPEPDYDLVVQKRVSRESLLAKLGRDLNG